MRILVVEDERKIAQFIKRGLKEEGYAVDSGYDGEEGHFLATTNDYDAIILDVMLPKMDGITLCRKLREEKITTPLIMLTAKGETQDKVSGLNSGADDYLTKPFDFDELLARVRAQLRKKERTSVTKLKVGDLEMDLLAHCITRADKVTVKYMTTPEGVNEALSISLTK